MYIFQKRLHLLIGNLVRSLVLWKLTHVVNHIFKRLVSGGVHSPKKFTFQNGLLECLVVVYKKLKKVKILKIEVTFLLIELFGRNLKHSFFKDIFVLLDLSKIEPNNKYTYLRLSFRCIPRQRYRIYYSKKYDYSVATYTFCLSFIYFLEYSFFTQLYQFRMGIINSFHNNCRNSLVSDFTSFTK